MSKIDHGRARDRDRAREAARNDSEVALLRVAGTAQGRKVLRKATCECGHEAFIAAPRFAALKVVCSRCGSRQTL
jgi:hypothetical protein